MLALPGKSGLYRGNFEFGVMKSLGKASWGLRRAVIRSPRRSHALGLLSAIGLFFVRVNQVLVRLWTRAIKADPLDW